MTDNSNFLDIITSKLRSINHNEKGRSRNSKILIVDGLNSFLRAFCAVPDTNYNGEHIGGYTGFLRSIGSAIDHFNPTRCIIVFDGKGGSLRRKRIYPQYKEGRAIRKSVLRRDDIDATQSEGEMYQQIAILADLLKHLPVQTISIDHIEADDTIAYLATEYFKDTAEEILIMSDDRDFLQLVDAKITVYRPIEKITYDRDKVLEKFGVPSHNFVLYKVFMGDDSDNIPGVNGLGPKRILKWLDILQHQEPVSLEMLYEYCESRQKESPVFNNVLNNKDIIERNWKLMNLKLMDISYTLTENIINVIDQPQSKTDVQSFRGLLVEQSAISSFKDFDTWLSRTYKKLDNYL